MLGSLKWGLIDSPRRGALFLDLLLLLILLGLSAAFSGSETAFFSLGAVELARMEEEGSRVGRRVLALHRLPLRSAPTASRRSRGVDRGRGPQARRRTE